MRFPGGLVRHRHRPDGRSDGSDQAACFVCVCVGGGGARMPAIAYRAGSQAHVALALIGNSIKTSGLQPGNVLKEAG